MNEPKFLDSPPDHSYEPTCEFKWIECDYYTPNKSLIHTGDMDTASWREPKSAVLCQRFQGTFKDVWVRVPVA